MSPEPAWLTNTPEDLQGIFRQGYEIYGDDEPAVLDWLRRLIDYKAFWEIVTDV